MKKRIIKSQNKLPIKHVWPGKKNVNNRTLFIGDNLPMLCGINTETIDLIYLDPPFNSNKNYAAPVGSEAAGSSFKDAWTLDMIDEAWIGQLAEYSPKLMAIINAVGDVGGKGNKSYLVFMARRLIELHRVLKESGSIYLHCDPTMSHSLKLVMDAIFGGGGKGAFKNEIIWHYSKWSNHGNMFQKNHDVILFYTKGKKYLYNKQFGEFTEHQKAIRERGYNKGSKDGKKIIRVYDKEKAKEHIEKAKQEGRIVYYIDNPHAGEPMHDVWDLPILAGNSRERTGYPTQKPLALLERIINASSNEGDVVLDPFCGCATACVAAESLNRHWIGIDISPAAKRLLKTRLEEAQTLYSTRGEKGSTWKDVTLLEKPAARTDEGVLDVNAKSYKHTLYGMQEGKCTGCLLPFAFRNLTIDHIMPQSKGGQDIDSNLQLLCGACNSTKSNRTMDELVADLIQDGVRQR